MAYLNKVMLIGNVGKEPTIKITAKGKYASFSIATSRRYRDNNGEQKEQTEWHNIVCWGKTAETIEKLHVAKGSPLFVEGTLVNRSWTDQNGQKRYTTEVSLVNFQLLSRRESSGGSDSNAPASASNSGSSFTDNVDYGEDLPF